MDYKNNKSKRVFKILTLIPEELREQWSGIELYWDKYLNHDHVIDSPKNITNYTNQSIDILYLWKGDLEKFKLHFYSLFKGRSSAFKYIIISDKLNEEDDIEIYKSLADDIVYLDKRKLLQWKTLAHARRHWNQYSKLTTIIYHDIIADFLESKFRINNKVIELTKIEAKLLRYLMVNRKTYVSKKVIFKEVWGYDDDVSRNLDQILFKLKKKIGSKYFSLSRKEGCKFE